MPVILFWAVPALIAGYYLVTIAELIDAALALAIPTEAPPERRQKFKVIEGGRT